MAHNLTFEATPAASVSLACCQSLCDLLRELPLPSAAHEHSACLSSRAVNHQNLAAMHAQLEAALGAAKAQLAELVFPLETTPGTTPLTTPQAMSPLALHLSLKGVFGNAFIESNSLETIEPSLKTSLGFDDSLKLIDDCLQNTAEEYMSFNDTNDANDDYSSLGDRVKSRRQQETTPRRHDDAPAAAPTTPANHVTEERHVEKVKEKKEKKSREREKREPKTETKSHKNHSLDQIQSKDSLAAFEALVSRLMSDSVERDASDDASDDTDDERNDRIAFDLRIDARDLNHLMALSSKLKHANKAKEVEARLGPKLTSFLSLLTNKMIVWFSKFKESDDPTTPAETRETTHDDNPFWQLLVNASKMALNLMTARGMSSRVTLFEELLETVVNFVSFNLNSRTHVTSKSPGKKKAHALTTCATKRQVAHWTELLELLAEYLARNKGLNDSLVLMVTRSAMSALLLNAHELQLVAIQLLTHVFRAYPKHRQSLLEDLLNQFPRIPSLRAAKAHPQSALTRLVQALTTCLFSADERLTREAVSKQLTDCLHVISAFLSSFVKKCLSSSASSVASSCDVDLKALFDAFLQDLLHSLYSPQNSSSLLLIQILTKLLVTNLAQTNKSAPLQLKLHSVEFLANICAKFGQLLSNKDQIAADARETLDQLLGADEKRASLAQRLPDVLRMLNRFFVAERLAREKVIVCALWSKEQKASELGDRFFALFSDAKTTRDDARDDATDDAIDATTAQLLTKALELDVFATVSRLFDACLSHVTSSLSLTTNTTLRSRAMKSLSQILGQCTLERSTQLLARSDLQVAMRSALLDASTSVREATVDLIGRFVLQSRSLELCDKYADLIGERVLDTGVSVRKRVIKILREICVQFPQFEKCGEIQLRIMKRAHDEGEGIRKLVLDTVKDLWFRHAPKEDVAARVRSLLHVVRVTLQSEGQIDSLAQLLEQIVKGEEALACAQLIADHVVAHVLVEVSSATQRTRALEHLAAMSLVAVLARICPELLERHVDQLQSLLSLSCDHLVDIHLQKKLIQALELILRRAANPSPALLTRLEEDLCKQILQSSALILPNCVQCLAVVIEQHTRNERLARDLFAKFQAILLSRAQNKPKMLRAIYSLGLFLKHFPKRFQAALDAILDALFALVHNEHALNGHVDSDLTTCCLTSLGFIVESDPRVCLRAPTVQLYSRVLRAEGARDEQLARQVLQNFCNYLSESMMADEAGNSSIEWSRESLKQMASDDLDDSNSLQSQIIQQYLPLLLDNALATAAPTRRVACNVVHVIQSGGHVHPLQLVPHLIAMTTDDDATIRARADHVLHEIERKFHGFVAMKARAGIELAQQLCTRLQCRGFRLLDDTSGDVTSRLATLYHVICTNRQSRRGFVQQLLRSFEVTTDDDATDDASGDAPTTGDDAVGPVDRTQLMFEMVLFFPFSVCDEVLYILQQLECIQSVNATHCALLFRDLFGFQSEQEMDEKFDENYEQFARELREESHEAVLCRAQLIRRTHAALKKVFVVGFLRRLLKEFYLLKDEKILEYSPNEAKQWEKPIHRRHVSPFNAT